MRAETGWNTVKTGTSEEDQRARAVELLVAGGKVTEVAKEVGVGRTTLWRWMRKNYDFRAELNRQRNALRAALADRLHALADQALSTVEQAVSEGDTSASLAVLKGCGLLDGRWPVETESAMMLSMSDATRWIPTDLGGEDP